MAPIVALAACTSYDERELDPALAALLADACDWPALCRDRATVLLKPNFVSAKPPASAVTTHPALIAAVARAVRRHHRGRLVVGDSPALVTATRVATVLGLPELLRGLDVEIVDFTETVTVEGGGGFGPLELARPLVEADLVINLPKVKTHAQMALTLGIKNLYGAFVGLSKARGHLHAGRDETIFARLLLEVARRVAPALTLADGIVGMEGNGPTAGRPRPLGLLAVSTDVLALDRVLTHILGFTPDHVPVLAQAALERPEPTDTAPFETRGQPPDRFCVSDWEPARPVPINATVIPGVLARPLRHHITTKPVFDPQRCTRCGQCVDHCGPHALSFVPRGRVHPGPGHSDRKVDLDLNLCIRCYCCQEICAQGAVSVGEGVFLALYRRLAQ
jgi:uncharacterized protein (DUF362 family)/NAD-dependent dihydropyrimidine dehydrogenase PreA subunit